MIDIDKYVHFIIDNRLTQPQFLLLYCMYKEKWELLSQYKAAFPSDDGSVIGRIGLDDLMARKYLRRIKEGKNADCFEITEKFTHIFIDEYEAGNELWDLYPAFSVNNGKRFPLSLMDKNEFRKEYFSRIRGDLKEHKEVLKDTTYAIQNNLLNYGIEKYVKGEIWTKVRKARQFDEEHQGEDIEDNKNFNTF